MAIEPGKKTSEFKAVIVAILATVALNVGVATEDEAEKIRSYEVGAIATNLLAICYAGYRTYRKATAEARGEDVATVTAQLDAERATLKAKARRYRNLADEIEAKLDSIDRNAPMPEGGTEA